MKINKHICLILCGILLCCTTACKQSNASSVVEVISSETHEQSTTSDNASSIPTPPLEDDISSVISSESAPPESDEVSDVVSDTSSEDTESDLTGYEFFFDHIVSAEYFCIKNIPQSDVVYAVTEIFADTGEDISIGCMLYSSDPNIKINKKTVTIPYEYKQQQKPAIITIKYSLTGQSYDLLLEYEEDWPMIFEDEFEGDVMDTTKWDHRPEWLRNKGYVNYFSKQMTFLDGEGHLVSRAAPGKKVIWDYSEKKQKEIDACLSGAVSTKDLFTSTYGYYEASVKLHHQTGMWGAFWLICGDMDKSDVVGDGSSENGCEIDVFESIYPMGGVAQNLHWDGFTGLTGSAPSNGYVTYIDTFDNEFHKFAISWTPNEYVFLIDGIVTRRINAKTAGGICNQPGYMLITTECGTWGGKWVLNEGEYSDMLVDYVRVYTLPDKGEK